MRRKAQVKFGETIGIIIIVYIVIVLGFVWYNGVNAKQISKIYEEDQRNRAFERYHYIMNLDLIHVAQRGYVDVEFDINGLRAFSNFTSGDSREFARSKLGDSLVNLKIYELNYTGDDVMFLSYENLTLYNSTPDYEYDKEIFTSLLPVVDSSKKKTFVGVLEVVSFRRIS